MKRQEQGIQTYTTRSGEKRYRVRWREGGKHRSRSFRRLSGESGARRFYRRMREAQEAGVQIARPRSSGMTLAAFVDEVWAPRARGRLAAKTWERDHAIYRRHIVDRLGSVPMASIDPEALVEWQDGLEHGGVGGPTMIKAISILSGIFREARRRPRVTGVVQNPVSVLDRPSAKRRRQPMVWGPLVVERVRYELLINSRRGAPAADLMALRDVLLVALMEMTGCRPGEALALRWSDIGTDVRITKALSGNEIRDRTKTGNDRRVPLLAPLRADLAVVRERSGDDVDDHVFLTARGKRWVETDWRNFRTRHFVAALERVEAGWGDWRRSLQMPDDARESVRGLVATRPYDLGRHTHSALMLAAGMSLQRLARIQGHSIRVLDETYSEELAEFQARTERIDATEEIERARALVWGGTAGGAHALSRVGVRTASSTV